MIIDKVKGFIRRFGLIESNDKILVGVSGGPDSVTLLYILNQLAKEMNYDLYAAHLNHKLRKDSDKDAQFVVDLCSKLNIGLAVKDAAIGISGKKGSLEEICRNERLKFFLETANAVKANKIALGHNLDDQAETVLMRLIRGSGLYGLSAILPKRPFGKVYIIRPLLRTRRRAIEAFLRKQKIAARIDKTNSENIYFRNKIRNRLLPLLEKEYNPNIKDVLSNTAETVGDDYDYLARQAEKLTGKPASRIDLKKFARLHPAMQRMVLRLSIAAVNKGIRRIDYKHINEIGDLILSRPVDSVVDLPKGVSVVKKNNTAVFYLTKLSTDDKVDKVGKR